MARTTYPPCNAPTIAWDSTDSIIPLYCTVQYKGKPYEVQGYSAGNKVWLKPVGGFQRIQVYGYELTLKGIDSDTCLHAKKTKYADWELTKAERSMPYG